MAERCIPLDTVFQSEAQRTGGLADARSGGPGVSFNA